MPTKTATRRGPAPTSAAKKSKDSTKSPRRAAAVEKGPKPQISHLRLYVAGQTRKSLQAIANLRNICETHLAGRYSIEVIDLIEHPELARSDQILAIPTLVRRLPAPVKKIIGDLSRTDRVLLGLDVEAPDGVERKP